MEMIDVKKSTRDSVAVRFAVEIKDLTRVLRDAQFAILYGSVISGAIRDDSDIDLAIMYLSPLSVEDQLRLTGEVSAVFHRDADLLDLRHAGPIIKMQVLRYGQPVIINDVRVFEEFRMYTPAEYFDYKIHRRPVEEAIRVGLSS